MEMAWARLLRQGALHPGARFSSRAEGRRRRPLAKALSNNSMQRTALRAAADAERYAAEITGHNE